MIRSKKLPKLPVYPSHLFLFLKKIRVWSPLNINIKGENKTARELWLIYDLILYIWQFTCSQPLFGDVWASSASLSWLLSFVSRILCELLLCSVTMNEELLNLLHSNKKSISGKGTGRYHHREEEFESVRPAECPTLSPVACWETRGLWTAYGRLGLQASPCKAPAASLCEWANPQGCWDRIGRESVWEGEGATELEDVHSSWPAPCHVGCCHDDVAAKLVMRSYYSCA